METVPEDRWRQKPGVSSWRSECCVNDWILQAVSVGKASVTGCRERERATARGYQVKEGRL